jgi:SRSO17 transposase
LEAFADGVLSGAVNRPVQLVNGRSYLRGLIEEGPRKSLEPMVAWLGGEADYESLQQFLAVSTWDPALVVKATAERVAPRIGVQAWVLDDTGFQYVFSIDKTASVFAPDTVFALPERAGKTGRGRTRLRPDRKPEPVQKLIERLAPQNLQTITFREDPDDGEPVTSQFAFLRVRALKRWENRAEQEPREEWLICE